MDKNSFGIFRKVASERANPFSVTSILTNKVVKNVLKNHNPQCQ
jgi:hypothetical protein